MSLDLETDIDRIEELAEENEDDNWGFRTFLKSGEISSRKVDAVVQRLNKKIAHKIDCSSCMNCCKKLLPNIKAHEIEIMANVFKMTEEDFIAKFLQKDELGDDYTINRSPCPFLKDEKCSLGVHQPEDCKTYPYMDKKDFVARSINMVQNTAVCPIVFNVYEALKQELWPGDEDDAFDDDFY